MKRIIKLHPLHNHIIEVKYEFMPHVITLPFSDMEDDLQELELVDDIFIRKSTLTSGFIKMDEFKLVRI